jgi:D-alanyl-D-alanine carboxypeptidase
LNVIWLRQGKKAVARQCLGWKDELDFEHRAEAAAARCLNRGKITGSGTISPHGRMIKSKTWDGDFMLRKDWASSRLMRVGVFGLFAITTLVVFTSDSAEARRAHAHRHYAHHHSTHHNNDEDRDSYSPQFSSIIVDANSGATLTSTSPDGIRHPASLTKIMTLYLLFERLDAGKIKLDTEMPVSEHASDQAPTKLGLRPGQSIRVEDAIKGLVTRSANDAAVVIAEAVGGDEDNFAKLMTHKARALGMSRTTYRNASGLPDDEQVTTARDQATLGRAIQDRFPRYYHYFSTVTFNYHGQSIRNHNHLLGEVEGVDGIKTGYTRASGFNLVTSLRRGNRHLVGVVMGGRSGGSRDATMRSLLAENLGKAATTRTAAAISERNTSDANVDIADADPPSRPASEGQTASSAPDQAAPQPARKSAASKVAAAIAEATAAVPPPPARTEPAPLTSGVIQTQSMAAIPGSSEPMKPVKVKTVQVKAGPMKLAAAGPSQPVAPATSAMPPARTDVPETSSAVMARVEAGKAEARKDDLAKEIAKTEIARTEIAKTEPARSDLPPQPPGFGTGNGILGVMPASHLPPSSASQSMAYAVPQSQPSQPQMSQPQAPQQNAAAKPASVHSGWIVQVGALESEGEAQQRIEAARNQAKGLLSKADPFTEPVVAKDNKTLYRARFAGLDRDQAESVCRALKRSDISCITIRN